MKRYLLSLFIFGFGMIFHHSAQAKKDTTIVYCQKNLDKTKKKYASYYAKVFKNQDGTYGVYQYYRGHDVPYMRGSFESKKLKVKTGTFTYFDYRGRKQKEGAYLENKKTGTWTHYNEEGVVVSQGEYVKNKREGQWVYYDKEGKKTGISNYKNGDLNGEYLRWKGDTLTTEGNYLNDEKHGQWHSWFKDGTKDYHGVYNEGKREGEWKFYFRSGSIAAIEQYEDGEAVKVEWFDEEGQLIEHPEELEQEPEFPGGNPAMVEFINETVNYPHEALEKGEQGIVYVSFVVNPDGTLTDIKVRKGVSEALDKESLRVIKKMPNWTPGIDHNRELPILFTLPIHFRLG